MSCHSKILVKRNHRLLRKPKQSAMYITDSGLCRWLSLEQTSIIYKYVNLLFLISQLIICLHFIMLDLASGWRWTFFYFSFHTVFAVYFVVTILWTVNCTNDLNWSIDLVLFGQWFIHAIKYSRTLNWWDSVQTKGNSFVSWYYMDSYSSTINHSKIGVSNQT